MLFDDRLFDDITEKQSNIYKNYIWLLIPIGVIFILLLTFKKRKKKTPKSERNI